MEKVLEEGNGQASPVTSCPTGTTICSECQEALGVIQRVQKYFCSPCWIHHCNFRFRKRLFELGKPLKGSSGYQRDADGTLDSRPKENVLVHYDGTTAAKALLHLLRDSVVDHLQGHDWAAAAVVRAGRLPYPFSFTLLYIIDGVSDEGAAMEGSANNETINFLQTWLEETRRKLPLHFPLPLVIRRLERTLSQFQPKTFQTEISDQGIEPTQPAPPDIHQQLLSNILQSLKSKSSRLDFLHILRQRLLVSTAKELGHRKVVLAEEQTAMAVAMFSIMSSGRGEQLAEQMNMVTELVGVDLCRPLMDLSNNDLGDYVKIACEGEDAALVKRATIDKKGTKKIDSIGRQCEEFIVSLQRDYPGTVPTLTRIGAKLEPNSSDPVTANAEKCRLCQRRLKGLEANSWCYGCRAILNDSKRPELLQETFL